MNTNNQTTTQKEKKVVTLAQALRDWEKSAADRFQDHLSGSQSRAFLKGVLTQSDRNEILKHLSYCRKCRDHLWDIDRLTGKGSILDVAVPRAAATQINSSFSLLTEGKRYRILFRKLLDQGQKGVVTMKVEDPYRDEMEGKSVVVMDSAGKDIVRGVVHNGETPGRIVDAGEIDWETVVVREDLSRNSDNR